MRRSLIFLLALGGCAAPPSTVLSPATGSTFGQFEVRAKSDALRALTGSVKVEVGGVAAYGVARDADDELRFTVQGAPEPGAVDVVASDRLRSVALGQLTYSGPSEPAFHRMVSFGASLTMGVQSESIALHGQVHGPAAQLARAAGAYLSLPLVHDEMLPQLTPDDFDLTTCRAKSASLEQLLTERGLSDVLPKVTDPDKGIVIARIRVDPEIEVRNVAIGGFKLHNIVAGGNDFALTLMEHLVWHPQATQDELFNEPAETMVDRVVALQPTLVVATDFFANDYLTLDLSGQGPPNLGQLTSLDLFSRDLQTLLARLDTSGAEVFVGNGPDVTFMPEVKEKVDALLAAGYSQEQATSWVTGVRDRIDAYNAELARQAAAHPHVHVVDVHGMVQDIVAHGVVVGDSTLLAKPFGGLVSFDGVHFSDTGYAVLANLYGRAINDWLGYEAVPVIDLAPVMADDPFSVEHLRALGFTCAGQLN